MPLDFSKLPTFAACDTALKALRIERKSFQYRDLGIELADDRGEVADTSIAKSLAKVNARIASSNVLLNTPGIDPDLITETQDELAALLVRRTALLKRGAGQEDGTGFLTDVDGEQADMQVAYLTTVIDRVVAHRATLSA